MRRNRSQGQPSPLTLGQAHAAQVRVIVWCKGCGHRVEPDIGVQMERYGASVTVVDWAARLRCSACGEKAADFVVTGARR